MNRIIGQFGGTQPGPLVIMLGAMHGNEPAGVRAAQEVFTLLNRAPDLNFKGKLIGLVGNRQAFQAGQRFMQQDLNRLWLPDAVQRILDESPQRLRDEELEIRELYTTICDTVQSERPEKLILLDLHTTSATGGVFCIPTDEADSLVLAKALDAPVILDLLQGINGTLLGFAVGDHFLEEDLLQHRLGVAFEAGQHDDPLSISRCIAAVVHCLRAVGSISPEALENPYDAVLRQYSTGLPQVTRLLHVHRVLPSDHFRMRPGYVNFQEISAGEHLADDDRGPILAPYDGRMLMPLYQPLGSDGFFLVEQV